MQYLYITDVVVLTRENIVLTNLDKESFPLEQAQEAHVIYPRTRLTTKF